MFSNGSNLTKCQCFLNDANDNEDTKAIAIPMVFSENSPVNNVQKQEMPFTFYPICCGIGIHFYTTHLLFSGMRQQSPPKKSDRAEQS